MRPGRQARKAPEGAEFELPQRAGVTRNASMQKRLLLTLCSLLAVGTVTTISSDTRRSAIGDPLSLDKPRGSVNSRTSERRVKINLPVSYKKCPLGDESPPTSSAEFEAEVLRIVNAERKKAGKNPLALDPDLTRAARYHANDMALEDYFSHESQDRENGTLVSVCKTFDRVYRFSDAGMAENIAAGQATPADVMTSWMKSPGHRKNIMSDAKTLGVGVATGSLGYGIYWVQDFGY